MGGNLSHDTVCCPGPHGARGVLPDAHACRPHRGTQQQMEQWDDPLLRGYRSAAPGTLLLCDASSAELVAHPVCVCAAFTIYGYKATAQLLQAHTSYMMPICSCRRSCCVCMRFALLLRYIALRLPLSCSRHSPHLIYDVSSAEPLAHAVRPVSSVRCSCDTSWYGCAHFCSCTHSTRRCTGILFALRLFICLA